MAEFNHGKQEFVISEISGNSSARELFDGLENGEVVLDEFTLSAFKTEKKVELVLREVEN